MAEDEKQEGGGLEQWAKAEEKTYVIEAPDPGYQGEISGEKFVDGRLETQNYRLVQYAREAGYTVDGDQTNEPNTGYIVPPDPREIGDGGSGQIQVGTKLRDVYQDIGPDEPLPPGNYLAPSNRNQPGELGNPHGPNVVNPEIHGVVDQAVLPGPVGRVETAEDGQSKVIVGDPAEEERRETEFSDRTRIGTNLTGDEDVTDVSQEMGESAGQPVPTAEQNAEETQAQQEATWENREDQGAGTEDNPQDMGTVTEDDTTTDDGPPKGNASREAWADYAGQNGATEDETAPVDDGGLTRDELRDKFGPK